MIEFRAPNLDSAKLRPDDYRQLARVFKRLSEFCEHKANLVLSVQFGNKAAYDCYRWFMEDTYTKLPEWAQWRREA